MTTDAAPVLLSFAALHRLRNHLQAVVGWSYLAADHAEQIRLHLAAIAQELADAADHTPPQVRSIDRT